MFRKNISKYFLLLTRRIYNFLLIKATFLSKINIYKCQWNALQETLKKYVQSEATSIFLTLT